MRNIEEVPRGYLQALLGGTNVFAIATCEKFGITNKRDQLSQTRHRPYIRIAENV
jgi:hypothetical protein